jgi:hypothetical protein
MIARISEDQVTLPIESKSQRTDESGCGYGHTEARSWPPFLDPVIGEIQHVHVTQLIEGDRCGTAELVGPWARITCRASHSGPHTRT